MGPIEWSSLIAGLDCGLDRWTGLLDWIAGLDSEERCQTSMQDYMCSEDFFEQGHKLCRRSQ